MGWPDQGKRCVDGLSGAKSRSANLGSTMAAVGQTRSCRRIHSTSAPPPRADLNGPLRDVTKVVRLDHTLAWAPTWLRVDESALVLPEVLEPIRRERRIAHSALNGTVAQVRLDRASVLTIGSQLEATSMAQHMAVDQKAKPGGFAGTGNHPLIASHAQRRPTFRDEDIGRCRRLPLQPAQRPAFPGRYRVHGRGATLGSPDMEAAGL